MVTDTQSENLCLWPGSYRSAMSLLSTAPLNSPIVVLWQTANWSPLYAMSSIVIIINIIIIIVVIMCICQRDACSANCCSVAVDVVVEND